VAIADATRHGHESRLKCFLAEALAISGQADKAKIEACKALELAVERGERSSEALALHILGKTAPFAEAAVSEKYQRLALDLASQLGLCPLTAHCHLALAELYRATGKRRSALRSADQAASAYRALGSIHWLEKAERLTTRSRKSK
jgi:hypothetical protein